MKGREVGIEDRFSTRLFRSAARTVERGVDRSAIVGWLVDRVVDGTCPYLPGIVEAPVGTDAAGDVLVSVLVPCFNYGRYLRGCVRTALDQAVNVEVLILDDASTDDTPAVAASLAAEDARVKVVRNEHNRGHIATVNTGYAEASGKYVVRLDADDLLTPGSLARAVALLESHPEVGLVYGHPQHFVASPPQGFRAVARSWTIWSGRDWIGERCRLGVNCITSVEAMMRTSVLRDVGFLDARLDQAEDLEQWIRIAAVSDVGHIDGADQGFHREHPLSMTAGIRLETDLEFRRLAFRVAFDRLHQAVPESAEWREQVARTLASEALDRASRAYDRGRAGVDPVQWLEQFALETYPSAPSLPAWAGLQRRKQVRWPPPSARPSFVAAAMSRRLREEALYLRWRRSGI